MYEVYIINEYDVTEILRFIEDVSVYIVSFIMGGLIAVVVIKLKKK